jgi:two-component system phosphate regulon response regulator OmpR
MSERILLVEDDQRLAVMVQDYLGEAGFSVVIAPNGADALLKQKSGEFNAIILDLMLPDIDGLEICRTIRASDNIPILMLTAKGDAMDRVVGLELGADDYLPKPFEPRELQARLKAILRRGNGLGKHEILRFGRLEIDRDSHEARLDGEACTLTSHQFEMLDVLARSAGRVLSRDMLMDALKGTALEAFDRSIDVHISRIRAEIEDDPKTPKRVITVRGAGYLFARTQD